MKDTIDIKQIAEKHLVSLEVTQQKSHALELSWTLHRKDHRFSHKPKKAVIIYKRMHAVFGKFQQTKIFNPLEKSSWLFTELRPSLYQFYFAFVADTHQGAIPLQELKEVETLSFSNYDHFYICATCNGYIHANTKLWVSNQLIKDPTIRLQWSIDAQIIQTLPITYALLVITEANFHQTSMLINVIDKEKWISFFKNGIHRLDFYLIKPSACKATRTLLLESHGVCANQYLLTKTTLEVTVLPEVFASKPSKGFALLWWNFTERLFGRITHQCQMRLKFTISAFTGLLLIGLGYSMVAPLVTICFVVIRCILHFLGYKTPIFYQLGHLWNMRRWGGKLPSLVKDKYQTPSNKLYQAKKYRIPPYIYLIPLGLLTIIGYLVAFLPNPLILKYLRYLGYGFGMVWILVMLVCMVFWAGKYVAAHKKQRKYQRRRAKEAHQKALLEKRFGNTKKESPSFWSFVRNLFWKAKNNVCKPFER